LTVRGTVGQPSPSAGGLGAELPVEESGTPLEGTESMREPGGFHAKAAVIEPGPTGVDPGLQLLEVVLQVAECCLLLSVSRHLGVRGPVG
jgi:hypothetical protein